jgi:hypothetical protein
MNLCKRGIGQLIHCPPADVFDSDQYIYQSGPAGPRGRIYVMMSIKTLKDNKL